jgi:transcriptional regulator with XRE-family HTH domain
MKIVGVNIKRLRETKSITLRELAKKLDVSASFLSQVETGKASPSVATLKSIADALNTTVGSLIGEGQKLTDDPVIRQKDRKSAKPLGKGIKIHLLTSTDPNKQMEPLLFTMDKNASSGESLYKHFGQEFIIVLKGELEITLNESKYILKKGDSIYFNSSTPHYFRNTQGVVTEALWVVTPPTF